MELSGSDGWLRVVKVLSLMREYEGDGFSVAAILAPWCVASPCFLTSSAPPLTCTLTVLLSAPTTLLAVHS